MNAATIELWRVDIADHRPLSIEYLSDDELVRANKFVFAVDQNRFVKTRTALRQILASYLLKPANSLVFQYNEHGRPEVAGCHFNLSHAGDWVLIAVSRQVEVGVDLSLVEQAVDWRPMAARSFSVLEQTALAALPAAEQEPMFYRIWSQKEAYTKAIGEGYRYGFARFSVVVGSGSLDMGLVADEKNPRHLGNWQFANIDLGQALVAIIAYHHSRPLILNLQDF